MMNYYDVKSASVRVTVIYCVRHMQVQWEARWPLVSARASPDQSGFEPWPGTLRCSWARPLTRTVPLSTQV